MSDYDESEAVMKKFFKVLFVLLGLALIGLSVFLYLKQGTPVSRIPVAEGSLDGFQPGDRVIVKGKLAWASEAKDDKFGFTADSPLLVRKVEMVQWYKNVNDEVYLTLSDRELPSFEFGGKPYDNPTFPSSMPGKFFSSGVTVGGIRLGDDILAQLAGGRNMILSSSVATKPVEDLPLELAEQFGLAKYEGYYATPGDEWALGDISVSFFYVDPSFYDEVTVCGTVGENGTLTFGENGRMWDKAATDEELEAVLRTDLTTEVFFSAGAGLLLIACAFIFFRRNG